MNSKNTSEKKSLIGHSRLPVIQAGGENDPQFRRLKDKEAKIKEEVDQLSVDELYSYSLFSANAKTSISLDFPVGQTCSPTALCASVCYAASPRAAATWRKSLRKRLRNLRYFQLVSPEEAAERMRREFRVLQKRWAPRAKLGFLRVNGGGDLFPELVPAVNRFAEENWDIRVWIVTRQFGLAAQIDHRPNIFLQLSLDATTPPWLVQAAELLADNHPRAYCSFLRTSPTDDTRDAVIVFNEKRTDGLPYNSSTDCPADAGRLPLDNIRGVGGTACAKCRKCFSMRTVAQYHVRRNPASKSGSGR